MVVAVIDVDWSLPYSLVRRVLKPPPTSIVLDDRRFRIVSNHLRGPLILSLPDWEELPARTLAADGSNVRSLAVEGDGISGLRVEFLEVALDRTGGPRGTP